MDFESLLGLTLTAVDVGEDEITFSANDGRRFQLYHSQDCCESVRVEEVIGDVADLIGTPILLAEEAVHENETPPEVTGPEYGESFTWTFYKLATVKGHVTIRFLGESNGYYSESVYFQELEPCR